jgi:hypothetical protein
MIFNLGSFCLENTRKVHKITNLAQFRTKMTQKLHKYGKIAHIISKCGYKDIKDRNK